MKPFCRSREVLKRLVKLNYRGAVFAYEKCVSCNTFGRIDLNPALIIIIIYVLEDIRAIY